MNKIVSGNPYHELGFLRSNWNKVKIIGLNPKYLSYRLRWNLLGRYPFKTRVPTHVDIELSSACNLKCTMCPHGQKDYHIQKENLDYQLAKKVIDECSRFGVCSLKFSGRGEAMLHPQFVELVKYAKNLGILDVMFNTNGLLLNKEKIHAVVATGVDLVIISIDGASKEVYEKIRIGSNYDTVKQNIEYLVNYRNQIKSSKPMIRLQFVKMKENIHEFMEFRKMWEDKVDVLVGLDYSMRVDQEDKSTIYRRAIERAYCPHPWRRLTITSSGIALMCCVDWDSKYPVGNCKEENIFQIWNGAKIEYARKCIRRLQHREISSCRSCTTPVSYKWKKHKRD